MSIKIDNVGASLPKCTGLIVIQSESDLAAVSVQIQSAREEVRGEWVESQINCTQVVTGFIEGEKGTEAFKLSGVLPSQYAVECGAAYKVVCEVEMKKGLTSAFEKGGKSKEYVQVTLVRVVEVWGSAKKCLWRADAGGNGGEQSPAMVMDGNGRLVKAEAGRS